MLTLVNQSVYGTSNPDGYLEMIWMILVDIGNISIIGHGSRLPGTRQDTGPDENTHKKGNTFFVIA